MQKSKQLLVAVMAVLVVSVSLGAVYSEADAQEVPFPSREKTISVSGMATTSVDPDLLTVRFGIETQEPTAQQALGANSEMMNKVISALTSAGISQDEISTSSINIHPVYQYIKDDSREGNKRELVGYKVSNIISVETKKLDLAASIIDGTVAAGVNRIDSVYYSLSPQTTMQLKDELIEQAINNAKSKAEKALAPLDHTIIGVKNVNLSDFSIPFPEPVYRTSFDGAESMAMGSAPTPVFSSEQDITTSAHVVFLIGSN